MVLKKTLIGGALNTLGGFLMAVSGMDIDDAIDIAGGVEKDYGNAIFDLSQELLKKTSTDYRIFSNNKGVVDFTDPKLVVSICTRLWNISRIYV